MSATRVQEGVSLDYTPTVDVTAGTIIGRGTQNSDDSGIGVAPTDIAANTLGSLEIKGIFDITKADGAGVTFAEEAKVYFDVVTKLPVTASGADTVYAGRAVLAAADDDTTVRVDINRK